MPNYTYNVLVNAVIVKQNKILIAQRSFTEEHEPGSWSIPGGKVENSSNEIQVFNIVEKTLNKEIKEEVGIEISKNIHLIANNTFQHSKGHIVLALVFLCEYLDGEAKSLEDTENIKWISSNELDEYRFPPNVREYLVKGFSLIPFMIRSKNVKEHR